MKPWEADAIVVLRSAGTKDIAQLLTKGYFSLTTSKDVAIKNNFDFVAALNGSDITEESRKARNAVKGSTNHFVPTVIG